LREINWWARTYRLLAYIWCSWSISCIKLKGKFKCNKQNYDQQLRRRDTRDQQVRPRQPYLMIKGSNSLGKFGDMFPDVQAGRNFTIPNHAQLHKLDH
jgi:hypothetical protein